MQRHADFRHVVTNWIGDMPVNQKNQPPDEYILVQEERLLSFVTEVFQKAGAEPEHAQIISRLLVNSDMRGVRSHGTRNANGYARSFEQGSTNSRPDIRVVHQTPTVAVIDGDGTLGYWPMVQAAELAVSKAREVGMGMGLVKHIGHYGSAGHYARICQEAGCIGFSVQGYRNEGKTRNGEPKPSVGFSGDPPICFAIPGGEEPGMVLDVGASVFGFYNNKEGYEDLLERLPGAFFRSMGLIAVSTLLGGALTGFTGPEGDAAQERWPRAGNGGMVLAIDVGQSVSQDLFRAEADRYARDLAENYAPIPGTDRIMLPGAIEEERMCRYRQEGIPYGEEEQASVRAAHEQFGVSLPWD